MDRHSRILITGGTGFLGQNLESLLLEKEYKFVSAIGRRNGFDMRSLETIRKVFNVIKPDIVFHLAAAVGGIGANRKSPATFWYENTLLGANLLEAIREFAPERTIIVGTTCSYPKYCTVPFSEHDLWGGYPEETNAPYGIAKKSVMIGAKAYCLQYGLDIVNPILTNLYGPGDHYTENDSHVVPDMIRKFHNAKQKEEAITLWGDGTPTRDFLYVGDACEGLVTLADASYVGPEPINFGSGTEVTMRELAHFVSSTVGYRGDLKWDTSKPNGQPRRLLETTRAKELGWKPTTTLQHGLMVTYEDFLGRSAGDHL
jgi:nucleoside-diphosphate-sugar epimerase